MSSGLDTKVRINKTTLAALIIKTIGVEVEETSEEDIEVVVEVLSKLNEVGGRNIEVAITAAEEVFLEHIGRSTSIKMATFTTESSNAEEVVVEEVGITKMATVTKGLSKSTNVGVTEEAEVTT